MHYDYFLSKSASLLVVILDSFLFNNEFIKMTIGIHGSFLFFYSGHSLVFSFTSLVGLPGNEVKQLQLTSSFLKATHCARKIASPSLSHDSAISV